MPLDQLYKFTSKILKIKETLLNKGSSYPKLRPYISVSGTLIHFSLGSHLTILIRCKIIALLDGCSCQGQIVHNSKSTLSLEGSEIGVGGNVVVVGGAVVVVVVGGVVVVVVKALQRLKRIK